MVLIGKRVYRASRCYIGTLFLFLVSISYGDDVVNDLKDYFNSYYSMVKAGQKKPKDEVLADINKIINPLKFPEKFSGVNRDFRDFDSLSVWLDKKFEAQDMSINLFWIEDIGILNCWLGYLVKNDEGIVNIWDSDVRFNTKIIDRLEIRDFYYFLRDGKEAIEAGTRNNTIYYNIEAFRIKAQSIWNFFKSRELEDKAKRYEPSRINRLRRQLYYKTWLDLYSKTDKQEFIDTAVSLLMEITLFHELGHIFANEYLMLEDEKEEEVIAFLTELRYGPLPYESLQTVISAAYQNRMDYYNLAGKEVIQMYLGRNIRRIRDIERLLDLSKEELQDINYKK